MSRWAALRQVFAKRPWWMNLLWGFCLFMTFAYVPWDLFLKPVAQDQEVWFGVLFTGWWAKVLAIPHWLVYGAGAYGVWQMKRWMWPWAALYTGQVAFGMAVWSLLDERGSLAGAVIAGGLFLIPTIALWRTRAFASP